MAARLYKPDHQRWPADPLCSNRRYSKGVPSISMTRCQSGRWPPHKEKELALRVAERTPLGSHTCSRAEDQCH